MYRILQLGILLITASSVFAQVNIQQSLGGYFAFDGNVSDTTSTFVSPFGANITYGLDRNNETNLAAVLDGSTSYVTAGTNFDPSQPFSISMWFRRTRSGTREALFGKYADPSCSQDQRQFFLDITETNILRGIIQGTLTAGNSSVWEASTVITDTDWHHVTFLYSGSSIAIYLDGVAETLNNTASAADKSIPNNGNSPLSFGAIVSVANCALLPFEGVIDDAVVHNRMLNILEIKTLSESPFFITESTSPANSSFVDSGETISITFNDTLGLVTDSDFLIYSEMTGTLSPTLTTDVKTVNFQLPTLPAGDKVIITAKSSLRSDDDISLYKNFTFNYYVNSSESYESPIIFKKDTLVLGADYQQVKAGDLDGDGDMDIVVIANTGLMGYYTNNGDGSYDFTQLSSTSTAPGNVQIADLEGDGDMDIFAANNTQVTIYVKDGSTYTPQVIHHTNSLFNVKVFDMDQDGDADLLMNHPSSTSGRLSYYPNTTGTSFGTLSYLKTATSAFYESDYGDIDGDNDIDIIGVGGTTAGAVYAYTNNGSGGYSESVKISLPYNFGAFPNGIAMTCKLVDVDGDRDLDIIVGTRSNGSGDADLLMMKNDGLGNFAAFTVIDNYTNSTFVNAQSINVNAGDLDGDGDMDLICFQNQNVNALYWYENTDGEGNYTRRTVDSAFPNKLGLFIPEIADVTGDGILDIIVANNGIVNIYENFNALTLVNSSPASSEEGVTFDSDIVLTFDQNIDANSVNPNVTISSQRNGSVSYTSTVEDNVVTLSPNSPFASADQITVTLSTGLLGTSNKVYAGNSFSFKTERFKRLSSNPTQGKAMTELDAPITVNFSHEVMASTVDTASFRVHSHFRPYISGSYSITGSQIVFTPDVDYFPGENVKVELTSAIQTTGGVTQYGSDHFEFFVKSSGTAENDLGFVRKRYGAFNFSQLSYQALVFDKDHDGDLDPLFHLEKDGVSSWYSAENTNGGNLILGTSSYLTAINNHDFYGIAEDLDKNGDMDVLIVTRTGSIKRHLFDGLSSTSQRIHTGVNGLANYAAMDISDIDNDGDNDFVFLSETYTPVLATNSNNVYSYSNLPMPGVTFQRPINMKLFDVNQDGWDDFIMTDYYNGTNAKVYIGVNNQTGQFIDSISFIIPNVINVEPYDIDLDGDIDIIVSNNVRNEFNILFNDGDFGFTNQVITNTDLNSSGGMLYFAIGDMDLDGIPDIVYRSLNTYDVNVLVNDGTGMSYTNVKGNLTTVTGDHVFATHLSLADLDGDGDLDITFGNYNNQLGSVNYAPYVVLENTIIDNSEPPVVESTIADVTFDEDNNFSLSVDLDTVFSDPENDILTYSVSSSNPAVTVSLGTKLINITPDANFNGTVTITVSASDGTSSTSTSFEATIQPINDSPIGVDVTVDMQEDMAHTFSTANFSIIDVDNSEQALIAIKIATLPNRGTFQYFGRDAAVNDSIPADSLGMLVYAPIENENAKTYASFTFYVYDDLISSSSPNTVTFGVEPVNDAPEFTLSTSELTVGKNFTDTESVTLTDLSPSNEANQTITYSISPGSISFANLTFDAQTGEASFTSVADADGSQEFTITADDGEGENNTYSRTFTFHVLSDAPPTVIGTINNQSYDEDAGQQVAASDLTTIFSDPEGAALTFSASTSEINVTATISGSQLLIESAENYFGTATISAVASDGNSSTTTSFEVTINPVNDAPVFIAANAPTPVFDEDGFAQSFDLASMFSDPESDVLTLGVSTDETSIVQASIVGTTLTITPISNASGSMNLQVSAFDGAETTFATLSITINPVNDSPTINFTPGLAFDEDGDDQTLDLDEVFSDIDGDDLTYEVIDSKSEEAALFTSSVSANILTITPEPDQFGTSSLTVLATDPSGEQASVNVQVTITSINDAPVFTLSSMELILEPNFNTTEVVSLTLDVPDNELSEEVTFNISPNNASLVNLNIVDRTIEITAVTDASGTQDFTITALDGQEVNSSFSQVLTITVRRAIPLAEEPIIFSVYPNPTASEVTVQLSESVEVKIYDTQGHFVLCGSSNQPIDVSQLVEGIYMITYTQSGTVQTQKLVIKH